MYKEKITIKLTPESISDAINKIEQYKTEMSKRLSVYQTRLAEEIAAQAEINFRNAAIDNIWYGSYKKPDVKVSVNEKDDILVIIANGEDAVWYEFGSGVYHNGAAGSSPHPYGKEFGFTIGSYGKGHGKQKTWGYFDENHRLVLTHGIQASMPMYNAIQTVAEKAIDIAREVFA